jgi:hypothetical protein
VAVLFSVSHPVTFALARRLKDIFIFSHLCYGNILKNLYKLLSYLSFEIVKQGRIQTIATVANATVRFFRKNLFRKSV